MKKMFASLAALMLLTGGASAQDMDSAATTATLRPAFLGISFTLTDFGTAQRIRNGSLSAVLRDDAITPRNQMNPGLAVTYNKGLLNKLSVAATLAGTYTTQGLPNRELVSDAFLLEADVSAQFSMLTDNFIVNPYLSAGLGASKFGGYFGAIAPVGVGLRFNLFDEAALNVASQYRVPITSGTANYHFMHSIGFFGRLGGGR